ncbi:MAG: ABC transporter ATP-binding protein [Pseudorhodoplanes sp.]
MLSVEGLRIDARSRNSPGVSPIVDDVSFSLKQGEVLGLIGESGAGKSTIGLAAMGYTRQGCQVVGGSVRFDGVDLLTCPASVRRQLRGRRIAYIAQSAAASFDPVKRIIDQICEAPVQHGVMDYEKARTTAIELLRELDLPHPDTFGEKFPHQASGGQLQRAMAAMAMVCRPDVLILDEPTTALDVTTQIEVLSALRRVIRDHRTAAIYITHDLAVIAQVATRIMVLRYGRTVEEATASEILHRPQMEYTRALLSVSKSGNMRNAVYSDLPPLLELRSVTAGYAKQLKVVDDINLSIRKGETVAVVGESGSGKSTLARVITGLLPLDAGAMLFEGRELPRSLKRRSGDLRRRIQLIYQMPDVALNPKQRVHEILGRPLAFYHRLSGAKLAGRVNELLEHINLDATYGSRFPSELSGGQKQRICIARALAAAPDIIICDEVTSALDPLVANEILLLLDRLQKAHGYAYMFITHDLGIVRRIAETVAVMQLGRIVALGPCEEIFNPPYHPYTEKLLASVPELTTDWLDRYLLNRRDSASTSQG